MCERFHVCWIKHSWRGIACRPAQLVSNLKKEEEEEKEKRWSKESTSTVECAKETGRKKNIKNKKIETVSHCECARERERECMCERVIRDRVNAHTWAGLGINWILGFIAIEVNALWPPPNRSCWCWCLFSCARVREKEMRICLARL